MIPSGWRISNIGKISKVVRGASPRPAGSPVYFGGSYLPWITVADVTSSSDMYLRKTRSMLTEEGAKHTRIFEPGTLLLSNSGATLGVPVITSIRAGANDGVAGFLEVKEVSLEYLYYFFQTQTRFFRESLAPGLGQPNLNTDLIAATPILIPSENEQHKISQILRSCDKTIDLTERLIAAKQERRTWLMQQLLTGKHRAPGFARKWTTRSMKELVEPIQRRIPKPVEAYKALGIRSHCKGTFERIINDPEAVDMDELYVAKAGDLIVNITFAWEGAIAFVPEEHDGNLVSHRFPTYRLKESIVDPEFMRYLVTLPRFRFNLVLISPGGAGRNRVMSKRDFLEIEVAVPCLEEQRQIGRMLKLADEEIVLLSQQLDALREQKKGLMQQLLTGKIRVKV